MSGMWRPQSQTGDFRSPQRKRATSLLRWLRCRQRRERDGPVLVDLFPARLAPQTEQERRSAWRLARQGQWGAALEVLATEALIVLFAGQQLATWRHLSERMTGAQLLACDRIEQAKAILRETRP